jgi:hypothetical protein
MRPLFSTILFFILPPLLPAFAADCPTCSSEQDNPLTHGPSTLLDSYCTEEELEYDPEEFTEPEQARIEAAIEEHFRKNPSKDKLRCDIRLGPIVRKDYAPHENAEQVERMLQMKPILYVYFKEFGERTPFTPPPEGSGESYVHPAAIEKALKAHIYSQKSRGLKAGIILFTDCLKSVGIKATTMAANITKKYGLSSSEIEVRSSDPDGLCTDYFDHPDNEDIRERLKNTTIPKGYQYTPFRVECPNVAEKETSAETPKASKKLRQTVQDKIGRIFMYSKGDRDSRSQRPKKRKNRPALKRVRCPRF